MVVCHFLFPTLAIITVVTVILFYRAHHTHGSDAYFLITNGATIAVTAVNAIALTLPHCRRRRRYC
jgi:hypothetical protein